MLKKTSEEWQKECITLLQVIDPDGWDRKNYQFSWYEEKISKEEFFKRVWSSTTKFLKSFKEIDAYVIRDTRQQKENDRV